MARHVYTLLCRRHILEADSGVATIVDLADAFNVDRSREVSDGDRIPAIGPGQSPFVLVTMWHRSSQEEGPSFARAEIHGPGEDEPLLRAEFELKQWADGLPRLRQLASLPLIPVPRDGEYEVRTFWRANAEDEWVQVGWYPFTVRSAPR